MTDDYAAFLASKTFESPATGLETVPRLNGALFDWQRDIVSWALRRGRACIFADCGLGKTLMQLEWARCVPGRVLILTPLAVAQQTVAEAARFDIDCDVAISRDGKPAAKVTVTNYEQLHKFNAEDFAGVVLDESSILKNYSGKTRNLILDTFRGTPYRLACTATPAPNDHMELGNHAEFVGVMTSTNMLASFFYNEGMAGHWRLKKHARQAFWRWVATWAVMFRQPSDLGYSDEGFELPPLDIIEHILPVDVPPMEGELFAMPAQSLPEHRHARRETLEARVNFVAGMVAKSGEPWLVWCELNDESSALAAAIPGAMEVTGSMDNDEKERRLVAFSSGELRVLVTKPSIGGFGMNWQHCARMAFVGLSHSFEQFYQASRRCWRFGQKRRVDAHVVSTTMETAVLDTVRRKQADHEEMAKEMVSAMAKSSMEQLHGTKREQDEYAEDVAEGNNWTLYLGDSCTVLGRLADESVDYSVFSPPFESLFVFSNSDRDIGNCRDSEEFNAHFTFLVDELLRVTKPGRLLSFHCQPLPINKSVAGYVALRDWRGELVRLFQSRGWYYHSEVVIWKDPVQEMYRNKPLGLLYKQLKKDSIKSRQGKADYLVTMRKPGENAEAVPHKPEDLPVTDWQYLASPVWFGIRETDTLTARNARDPDDEKHIAPLQLETIRNALTLWSKPGDLILSPFAGIGSEGYVALQEGRRFVGVELKRSYWEQARKNLAVAVAQQSLNFGAPDE